MCSLADLSILAQFLQSECATRWIQFRDGGFYLGDDEVTGEKFIADLQCLKFGEITRAGNQIVAVREGRPVWSYLPRKNMSADEELASFSQVVADARRASGVDVEPVIILGLENYDSAARANYVADSEEGKAAIGALCRLCARRLHGGGPIVQLGSKKRRLPSGVLSREPQLVVLGWQSRGGPFARDDDDIPF